MPLVGGGGVALSMRRLAGAPAGCFHAWMAVEDGLLFAIAQGPFRHAARVRVTTVA